VWTSAKEEAVVWSAVAANRSHELMQARL